MDVTYTVEHTSVVFSPVSDTSLGGGTNGLAGELCSFCFFLSPFPASAEVIFLVSCPCVCEVKGVGQVAVAQT